MVGVLHVVGVLCTCMGGGCSVVGVLHVVGVLCGCQCVGRQGCSRCHLWL